MNYDEMTEAVEDARRTLGQLNRQSRHLAKLLVGNLRNVSESGLWSDHETLVKLKAELTQYDARRRQWKN